MLCCVVQSRPICLCTIRLAWALTACTMCHIYAIPGITSRCLPCRRKRWKKDTSFCFDFTSWSILGNLYKQPRSTTVTIFDCGSNMLCLYSWDYQPGTSDPTIHSSQIFAQILFWASVLFCTCTRVFFDRPFWISKTLLQSLDKTRQADLWSVACTLLCRLINVSW